MKIWIIISIATLLMLLGTSCLIVIHRHRNRRRGSDDSEFVFRDQSMVDAALTIHQEKDRLLKEKHKGRGYAPHQEKKSIDQILEKMDYEKKR